MHARVTSGQVQPGKMQEAIDIVNNSIAPAAKAEKGFQGLYVMTDAASGKVLAISVWETEADMSAVESSGHYQENVAKLGSVIAGPTTTDHYELSVEASA